MTTDGQVTTLGGFPVKYFPRQVAGGPGGTVWVTMEIPGENLAAVARVSGVEAPKTEPPKTDSPPPPVLETTIGKGPKSVVKTKKSKAKVKFRFSSPTANATFECSLTRLKGKKTKVGAFNGCKSP